MKSGCANLGRHIENVKSFGVPVVVAINHFVTDPSLRGAPTGHSVPVREVRLSAGAGFIVVVCGEIEGLF